MYKTHKSWTKSGFMRCIVTILHTIPCLLATALWVGSYHESRIELMLTKRQFIFGAVNGTAYFTIRRVTPNCRVFLLWGPHPWSMDMLVADDQIQRMTKKDMPIWRRAGFVSFSDIIQGYIYRGVLFPLWCIWLLCTLPLGIRLLLIWRRDHSIHAGLCLRCGYDLRASHGRCPECGTPISRSTAEASG